MCVSWTQQRLGTQHGCVSRRHGLIRWMYPCTVTYTNKCFPICMLHQVPSNKSGVPGKSLASFEAPRTWLQDHLYGCKFILYSSCVFPLAVCISVLSWDGHAWLYNLYLEDYMCSIWVVWLMDLDYIDQLSYMIPWISIIHNPKLVYSPHPNPYTIHIISGSISDISWI